MPRGELYVLQYLVEQATHHSHIEYVTDSKVNADLFNKGFDRATTSSNCDLFKFIFQDIQFKNLQVEVRWMPSHMQEDYLDKGLPIPGNYTLEDIKANDHADALAQEAAKRQQVMLQIASDYLY